MFPRGRRCELPLTFRRSSRATELVGTLPKNQGRFHRRLVKAGGYPRPETPSSDNQALASLGTTLGPKSFAVPSALSPKIREPWARSPDPTQPQPGQSARSKRHLPVSASSRKHEHTSRTIEPRSSGNLFSSCRLPYGCEPQSTRAETRADTPKASALRAVEKFQRACAHWRRGRTESRRVLDGHPIPSRAGTWKSTCARLNPA